ncbi:MAG: glycosyltransferase family 2 protein [Caldilineaceae bacterium]|nr:glycosyltransferase family 2 protein [Caldilineaceae bacterium]
MEIAVVIINYNTRELLRRSLSSLIRAQRPPGCNLTIIVVDNASHDGSDEMVTREFPQVTLVASFTNLGFTGGNNLALYLLGFRVTPPTLASHLAPAPRSTPPDFVLLLNPDAEVAEDAITEWLGWMERLPSAGICGAHLRYGDGSFQHGAFQFPSLAQVTLDFFPLVGLPGTQRLRDSRWNGRYPMVKWQGNAPFPVDFVLGAAMFVRAAAINDIGGLDDGYFMYCEEMDWALRMQEAGWRVYAIPTAHVTHHEGQSSRQVRWDAYERLWRSRFRFYRKHAQRYPAPYRLALRLLVRLGAAWRSRQARQRFATGAATGKEIARELEAYAAITRF